MECHTLGFRNLATELFDDRSSLMGCNPRHCNAVMECSVHLFYTIIIITCTII